MVEIFCAYSFATAVGYFPIALLFFLGSYGECCVSTRWKNVKRMLCGTRRVDLYGSIKQFVNDKKRTTPREVYESLQALQPLRILQRAIVFLGFKVSEVHPCCYNDIKTLAEISLLFLANVVLYNKGECSGILSKFRSLGAILAQWLAPEMGKLIRENYTVWTLFCGIQSMMAVERLCDRQSWKETWRTMSRIFEPAVQQYFWD